MHLIHSFESLQRELATERAQLVSHPVYDCVRSIEDVRVFMEHHVFAVWDFMSLLKTLQRELTCVDVPWVPRSDGAARRLINEMVVGEESDDHVGGGYTSHFELYREAMRECGADVDRIDEFVSRVSRGESVWDALAKANSPPAARRFVENTFATISSSSLPQIAAAFTVGREEIIPDMFTRLVTDLSHSADGGLAIFEDYLRRHIHLDGERHGPMAAQLLESVCGASERHWADAYVGARSALLARRALWDEIASVIGSREPHRKLRTSELSAVPHDAG